MRKKSVDDLEKYSISQCYIVVRKLSLAEISRIVINPSFVRSKCGHCLQLCSWGPKCNKCLNSYHYDCAQSANRCCGKSIIPIGNDVLKKCQTCKFAVQFGHSCTVCNKRFHSYCIGPFDQCCQYNICELPRRNCATCKRPVFSGPRCPICGDSYHLNCVEELFKCCGIQFPLVDNIVYKCAKCKRNIGKGSPICTKCGKVYHKYCARSLKQCCGQPVYFEIYFVPSFKFATHAFDLVTKRKTQWKELSRNVLKHKEHLNTLRISNSPQRKKRKSISCQTSPLDNIEIISIKSEVEEEHLDIPKSPPLLEREDSYRSSISSIQNPDSQIPDSQNDDDDDPLKNFFDFLYQMVKKLPQRAQSEVKIDLFKAVVEAEVKSNQ